VRRSWPRRLLNRLEIDRATFYGIASRYWKLFAGPITLLLMAEYFTLEVQGFYYLFSGIIALQTYFELAFPGAIITTASHQWTALRLDEDGKIVGDADHLSRLTDLMRGSAAIFVGSGIAFGLVAGGIGWSMFMREPSGALLDWQWPWVCLITLAALAFSLNPFLAVLEGCDQVRGVYKMQLAREVLGNLIVWGSMIAGAQLWVPVSVMAMRLLIEGGLVFVTYRSFFSVFRHGPAAARLNWKQDVLPFQSRLFIRGVFAFLRSDIMLLLIFSVHEAVPAGQFGATFTTLMSVRLACSSWVRSRVPHLGSLIKRRDYREVDRIFFRVGAIALAMMAAMGSAVCVVIALLGWADFSFAERFTTPLTAALLAIGMWATLAKEFQWMYLHAHGRSPYLLYSILGSLVCGTVILSLGVPYAALGCSAAYAAMQVFVFLPASTFAFVKLRRQWHAAPA